jgi:hypothetical protein
MNLLSIPNIASDRENIVRNAETIARMMEKLGIGAKLVSAPGSNSVVVGEIRAPGAIPPRWGVRHQITGMLLLWVTGQQCGRIIVSPQELRLRRG